MVHPAQKQFKFLRIRSARRCLESGDLLTGSYKFSHIQSRLIPSCRSVIWQVFPTQEMAFTFADAHGSKDAEAARLAVLSFEDASTGRRRFLVTTFNAFWQRSAASTLLQLEIPSTPPYGHLRWCHPASFHVDLQAGYSLSSLVAVLLSCHLVSASH
jgi:hypothetical protein